MTNVQICVASAGTWLSSTAVSILGVCTHWLVENSEFLPRTGGILAHDGCNVAANRHTLVNKAINKNATHVLFLDSDMTYPDNTIVRLLRHNKDIVGANGPKRCKPIEGTAIAFGGNQFKTTESDTGLQEVAAMGTGCMLVNIDVFKNMGLPWFEHRWIDDQNKYIGSDVFFCVMARDAGYKIFIDHDISKEIAHIGDHSYMFKEEYNNGNE